MSDLPGLNPTTAVKLDFEQYARQRQTRLDTHLVNGIPDYSFSLDARLRASLASVGVLRTLGQGLASAVVPLQRQIHQMNGIAVGPRQFPEIQALGEDCARILGIGLPQIFIVPDPSPNGFTYCTGDTDQILVLTRGLVQMCTPLELKSVIGHECGHIHNQHTVYNIIWQFLTNPLAQGLINAAAQAIPGLGQFIPIIQAVMRKGLNLLMGRWSRCAEITSDRAGLICCGSLETALNVEIKMASAGMVHMEGFNEAEYFKQMERVRQTPLQYLETERSHPLGAKRMQALRLFSECEVYYSWRPEARSGAASRTKEDVDLACEKFII